MRSIGYNFFMSAIPIGAPVRIPGWVTNLTSFRRWARSPAFPDHGWIAHLGGELWVDLSMERAAHNQGKGAINATLTLLANQADLGNYFSDRMLLTNEEAGLSTEPDGMFVSHVSVANGAAILAEGDETLEVQGTPDMVLEVISDSSVEKDLDVLFELYWRAGISEYWIADVRGETPQFTIYRRGSTKYIAATKRGGWQRSQVFAKAFRLIRVKRPGKLSKFVLETR